MVLRAIEYQGFRNLTDTRLDFDENLNLITGDNGAGKTNLLEAIFFSASASSFRTSNDNNLIKLNQNFLRVAAATNNSSATIFYNGEKRVVLNGVVKDRLSDFIGWLLVTVLSLEDIWLVRGSPAKRRTFLDWLIAKIRPTYLANLSEYRKVLKQRNRILQTAAQNCNLELLEVYNQELIRYGNEIYQERKKILAPISENLERFGRELNLVKLGLTYQSTCSEMELNNETFKKVRKEELKWGATIVGPHRDDLLLTIDGHSLKNYGSEGEQYAAVFALKLSEAEILYKKTGQSPILLLDEVAAELDQKRKNAFFNLLKGQIFYASTQHQNFTLAHRGRRFRVQGGIVEVS